MNTTKKNITLDFLSTLIPENAIALTINKKAGGFNRSHYSLLLAKFFTFCLFGMLLFTGCKKDIDLLPTPAAANQNDTLLKAGVPTFYVATNGSDANGNGTSTKPWASLYKASQMVTTSGYTIHIAAGTYTESHVCTIAVGVSVVGDGPTTIIKGTYKTAGNTNLTGATILLNSSSPGTNGNQSLSYFTLDGNALVGSRAICVRNRGNVSIHHMTIKNFFLGGVLFCSSNMYSTNVNAVLEQGNKLYNCTIDNCGDKDTTYDGDGLIFMTCQKDMLIHDNLLYSNKRSGEHNGNIINAGGTRFRNVKYYNNHSWKPDPTYGGWNFHLEIWGNDGGFEIYNNTFTGGGCAIDAGGHGATEGSGGYAFSWSIHDNLFELNTKNEFTEYAGLPILLESYYLTKTLIYNNTFSNTYYGITLTAWNAQGVYIYDNVFNKIRRPFIASFDVQGGTPVGSLSATNINIYRNKMYPAISVGQGIPGCISLTTSSGWDLSNVNIYNNTLVTNNVVIAQGIALTVGAGTTMSNVNIKNNILCYMRNVGPFVISNKGTFNGLHIENNLSYNKANFNILPIRTGNAISNYTYVNNIPKSNTTQVSPRFVNESAQDFHLQTGSPAINKGVNVGLPYLGSAPDISAYESTN